MPRLQVASKIDAYGGLAFLAFVAAAMIGAVRLPAVQILLVPLAFGVVHVSSDLRYLLLRRENSLKLKYGIAAAIVLWLLLRSLAYFDLYQNLFIEVLAGLGIVLAASLFVVKSRVKKGIIFLVVLAFAYLAWHAAAAFLMAVVHFHNFVALGIWFALARKGRWHWSYGIGLALCVGAILFFAFKPAMLESTSAQLGIERESGIVALFPQQWWSFAFISFVLMQTVHLGAWAVFLPWMKADGNLLRDRFSHWRKSWKQDFGWWGLAVLVSLVMFSFVGGVIDPIKTKYTYLSFAGFHVWLEFGMLAAAGAKWS